MRYTIDRTRVLVVGYSMGGRGTWHMAVAASGAVHGGDPDGGVHARDLSIDQLGRQPTYIIHSREDEVVPFEPAEEIARDFKKLGREVEFEALDDFTHFDMVSYVDALRAPGDGSQPLE